MAYAAKVDYGGAHVPITTTLYGVCTALGGERWKPFQASLCPQLPSLRTSSGKGWQTRLRWTRRRRRTEA